MSISSPPLKELLRSTLDKGASFRFRARGFSMSPSIKDGDIVIVGPLKENAPRLGEIVAFIHPKTERLLIHRVVGKRNDLYLLKGDNVSDVDDLVPQANVLGSVRRAEREGRKVPLGLGPEGILIAFLNRMGLFLPLVRLILRLVRPL